MAKTIGIFGLSGIGKSTSIVVDKDGKFDPNNYGGLDPDTTLIIEADKKDLPFPSMGKWKRGYNVSYISSYDEVSKTLRWASAQTGENGGRCIKNVIIDTVNGMMIDKEVEDMKKAGYDKWQNLALDIYKIVQMCNTELREDMIVFIMGHVGTYEDPNGDMVRKLVTNGKKLDKICIESKLPIVLMATAKKQATGKMSSYIFETQANNSTAKSPIGMFDTFEIPNSLKVVEDKARNYYGI